MTHYCAVSYSSPLRTVSALAIALVISTLAGCARFTHERLHSALWTQTSGEYRAIATQTFQLAEREIVRSTASATPSLALPHRPASAECNLALATGEAVVDGNSQNVVEEEQRAVIVDIDETVLDNSPFQTRLIRANKGWDDRLWDQWVLEARAELVPGAGEFLRAMSNQSVLVFYVTNRDSRLEEATLLNLRKHGLPFVSREHVLMKGELPYWTSRKECRRRSIAERFWVVGLVGDDLEDFIAIDPAWTSADIRSAIDRHREMWGRTWFVLPNPSYGSWERHLLASEDAASDAAILRLKYRALVP